MKTHICPRGFTLIELLVVISIIAVLIAVILPSFRWARERVYQVTCLSNQRQTALAVMVYTQDYDGYAPALTSPPIQQNNMPWNHWDKDSFVGELQKYVPHLLEAINCPSHRGNLGKPYEQPGWNAYATCFVYLPGLNDPAVNINTQIRWFDSDPSAADLKLENTPGKIMMGDLNVYAHGEGWAFANHTNRLINSHFSDDGIGWSSSSNAIAFEVFWPMIQGGNRIYADGHGDWVLADEMSADNSPIAENPNGHYSHEAFNRPYYW